MIVEIAGILQEADLLALREVMNQEGIFEDGRRTAGWKARERKHNLQAAEEAPVARGAVRKIRKALESNSLFNAAARPKEIARLLLSRYEPGMAYGTHIDDAVMDGLRTDVSFTLFVSEPDSYEGGHLVIEGPDGERSFKPPAGHLIVYPATTLHRVDPVTAGVRLVAVGWVRSLIRSEAQREILFDLDRIVHALRESTDQEAALDLALKTRANLMRRWLED